MQVLKSFNWLSFRLLISISTLVYLLATESCSNNEPVPFDCNLSDLDIDAIGQNPTSCTANDGIITATAMNGNEPYKYAINTSLFSASPLFIGLGGGSYLVSAKDKNGCIKSVEVLLEIPGDNPLTATAISISDTECVGNNGSIQVTPAGGTEPYQIKIGASAFSDISTFNGLAPGNYSIAVRDQADCIFTKSVTVSKGDSQTSLSSDVEPIIDTKCAITGCHNGSQSPDLRPSSAIIQHAAQIKSLTQSGSMPQGGSLLPSQKALIACWVDEGAKDN